MINKISQNDRNTYTVLLMLMLYYDCNLYTDQSRKAAEIILGTTLIPTQLCTVVEL